MTDDKQLDHLISVLYEAVLDSGRWQEALGLCGLYAGGIDAQFLTIDKKHNIPIDTVHAATVFPLQSKDDYANYFGAIDPRLHMVIGSAVGEWFCCHHTFDQNFVDHNEFYQDFLIPYGARYAMGGRIDDNEDHYNILGVIRAAGQQPFGDAELLAAQHFSGHLQRVLRLQRHTQNLHTKAKLGARAIDALALSILIVDDKGCILHLNAGAERLLNNPLSGLTGKTGHLSAADHSCKNKLTSLITNATGYPAVGGAMFLNCAQTRQLFVAPLPAVSPFAQDWQMPLALVLVMDTDKNLSALQLQAALYDLSPAELRIASALLAGKSLEAYAQEAGVMVSTARTQLKKLFIKTGTHRQSELVAALSRVPPLQN